MTKQEILDIVNQLPDDKPIDLIVNDGNDNWDCSAIAVDNFDKASVAELIFILDDGYMVEVDEDRMEVLRAKKEEDDHLNSMEYVCESIVNGQWRQAVKLFKRGKFVFKEFSPLALEFGLSREDVDSFVDMVLNYED